MKKLIAQTSAILGATLFLFVGCSKKTESKHYVVGEDFDEEAFIASESNGSYDDVSSKKINFEEYSSKDKKIFASAEVPDISLFKYEFNEAGDGLIITEYNGTGITNLKFPDEIEGFPVVQISFSMSRSYNYNGIKTIVFPDSVKSLENFDSPHSVENVYLPASLESIPSNCFKDCKNLKKLIIPNSLKKIGVTAFYGSGITSLIIPEGVEELESAAFKNAYYLQNIKLPSSLKIIDSEAFSMCFSLKSVDIPEGITEISSGTFKNCISLESVKLPNSLKTIGSAFSGCISLKNLSLPDGLETLDEAFDCNDINLDYFLDYEKEAFEKVVIDNSIDANLSDGIGLVSLEIPDSVTNFKGSFCGLRKLEYLKLPNTVQYIDAELLHFYHKTATGLKNLKTIVLPSSCEKIGPYAFTNLTALEKIEIPESITQLEFIGDEYYSKFFSNTNLNLATQARLRQLGYKGSFN